MCFHIIMQYGGMLFKVFSISLWSFIILCICSVQFSSGTQSCPTLCDPMDCSTSRPPCPSPTPRVYSNSCPSSLDGDAIQPSHPLSSPSPPAFNLFQHLFQ